jgi:hypothetical protein
MHLYAAPLSLAILVATAGLLTAAQPPEDLPVRPQSGQKVAPVRDPAVPSPGVGKEPASAAKPDGGTAATPADTPATNAPATTPSTAPAKEEAGGAAKKAGAETATKEKGCGKPGCTSCIPQVATCKATWDDKKTKKATFTQKCDFECSRPWEPYHQGNCCEEKTTPCGNVHTKKKLFKTEEEKVERVLKYEVVMQPAAPCCEPEPTCLCLGCRCLGSAFERVFSWCH